MDASLNESRVGETRSAAVSLDPAINTKDAFSCDKHCESTIGQRFYSMLDSQVTGPSNRVRLYERTNQLEDVYQKRWAAIKLQPRDSGCYSSTTEEIHLVSPNHFQSTGLPQQGAEDYRGNGGQIRESEDASLANVSVGEVFNKDCDNDVQHSQALQSENASFQVSRSEGLGKTEVASRFQSVGKNRLVGLQNNFSDETPDTRTKSTMSDDKQGDEQHVQTVKRHDQRDANICRTQDPTVAHLPTVAGDVTDERLYAGKDYGEKRHPSNNNGHVRIRSHTTHKKEEESDWKCPGSVPHHLASNSRDASTLKRDSRQSFVDEQGDYRGLTMQLWALRGSSSVLEVPVFLHNSHVHPQPFEKKPAMMAFDSWANKTMSVKELAALHVGARFNVNRSCSKNTERLLKGLTKYLLNPKAAWKTYLPGKAGKEINIQRISSASDIANSIKSSTLQSLDSNKTNDNEVITGRSYQHDVNSRPVSVAKESQLLGKAHSAVILPLIYLRRKGRDLNKSDKQRPPIANPEVGNPKLPQSGNVRRIILDRRTLSCLATLQQRRQKEKGCEKPLILALKTTRSSIVPLDKGRECHIKTVDSKESIMKVLLEKHKLNCEGSEQGLPTAAKEQEDGLSLLSDLKLLIAKVYDTNSVSQTPSGGDLSSCSASARRNNVRNDETWKEKVNGPSVKLMSEQKNASTTKNADDDGKTGEEAKWPWQKGLEEEGIICKSSSECFSADAGKQVSRLGNLMKNELASFKDDVKKANEPMEGTSSEILGSIPPQGSSSYPQLLKPLYPSASESQAGIDYCSSLQDESKTKNIKVGKESNEENSVIVCQSSPLSVQTIFNEKEQKESQVLESTLCENRNLSLSQESRNCGIRILLTDKEIHIKGVAQKPDDLDLFHENPEKLSASLHSVRPNEQTRKVCEPSQQALDFALPIEAVKTEMSDSGSRLILNKGRSRENTVPTIGKDKKQKSKECENADEGFCAEKEGLLATSVMDTRPAAGQCNRHPPSSDLKMFSENRNQAIVQNGLEYAGPGTIATTDSQQRLQTDISAEVAARKVTLDPTGSLVVTVDELRGQRSALLLDTSSGGGGRQELHSHFLPRAITKRNVAPCTEHWSRAEWRAEMNDDRGVRATNWPLPSQKDGRVRQQPLSKDPRDASLHQRALPKNSAQNCAPVQQVQKYFNPVQQTQKSVPPVQQASKVGWSRHPTVVSRIEQQKQVHRPSSSHFSPRLQSRHGQPPCYQQPTIVQQHSHQRIENQEVLSETRPPRADHSTKGSSTDKSGTWPFSVVDCNLDEIIDNPLTRSSPFTVNLKMSIWSPGYHLLPQVEDCPLGETRETCRCHQKKLCGPRCIRRHWL